MPEVDNSSPETPETEVPNTDDAGYPVQRDDVVQGFRIIFGREPEDERTIEHHRRVSTSVWDLVNILMSSQEYRSPVGSGAHLSMKKCLYEVYLAHNINHEDRISCFLKTHSILSDKLRYEILEKILFDEIDIWRSTLPDQDLSVSISMPRHNLSEGELCLTFKQNGRHLYVISFSFVPGSIVQKNHDRVILISRMQGMRGEQENIRAVSKLLREVYPQAVLFSVLCGIGKAIDAAFIASVDARNHIYFQQEHVKVFERTYDEFIASQGAATKQEGYLLLELPLKAKPLTLISSIHRLRTKKKRLLKEAITEEAAAMLASWFR